MGIDILTKTFIGMRERLHRSASRLLEDDDAANDALQDAFYRLWQKRDKIETQSQAEGMSVITVKNICIDMLRHQKSYETTPIETAEKEISESYDKDQLSETYNTVRRIIEQRLNERERQVVMMRDSMGMAFADIAEELGITENNVRMILSRARRTVREIYISLNKNQMQ